MRAIRLSFMGTTNRPGRPRAGAERDLRSALLATSRSLLDQGGPGALSMREVARRAGCTHQAPYHYFRDRETILAELVREGFDLLAQRLRLANDQAKAVDARSALVAAGSAYVDFALEQPGVFRIMFRPDMCDPTRFPAVLVAGTGARAELDRLNVIVHRDAADAVQASILWAHVHGLACLLVDGPLSLQFNSPQARADHVRDVAQRFADLVLSRPARRP